MLSRIGSLTASARQLYSRLSRLRRIGIFILVGVLVFVFVMTMGVKQSPPRMELSGFEPYRPELRGTAKRDSLDRAIAPKEGEFPAPPSPGAETTILEEIKSLRAEIEGMRFSLSNMSENAKTSTNDRMMSAISEVQKEVKQISLDLKSLKEKLKKDEQALKEQAPVDLLAIVSSGGLAYAILRTEAGDKRVTTGDKIGPWMIDAIGEREVHLEGRRQKRILRLK